MIKAVLTDIDNTLLDFEAGASQVIENTFRKSGIELNEKTLNVYYECSDFCWGKLDKGEMTHDQIVYGRWDMMFERLGLNLSSEMVEDIFEDELSGVAVPEEGAVECMRILSEKYPVYLASNSFAKDQVRRMTVAGIADYISGYFLSHLMGVTKPHKEYFELCMQKIGVRPEEIVMIGDSALADTKPAKELGMKTILYDKHGGRWPPNEYSDYTVKALMEIPAIIDGIR